MTTVSYHQAIANLERRGMMPDRPPGLNGVIEGLRRIGFSQGFPLASRTIVVAGTNGKGSVCATLEAIFSARGERVGLYTSPHLIEHTERIRIGCQDISRELFAAAFTFVDERTGDLKLSHFETVTLMAIWLMCSGKAAPIVERLILEVGLGGIWDATNAVPHTTSVITALGLDHQNLLGATLTDVAQNKLGIIRPNTLVVHAPFPSEIEPLVDETRQRLGGRWVCAKPFEYQVENTGNGPRFFIHVDGRAAEITLPGRRGAQNTALALTIAQELGAEPDDSLAALSKVRWPGRMERAGVTPSGAPIYLSGDHNPHGIASLLELLPHYSRTHLHVLVGVGKDKDLEGVLTPLFGLPAASLYLTETPFRGRPLDSLGHWRQRARGAWADPATAFREVAALAAPGEMLLVTGSLYLVGAIRALLPRRP